MRQNTISFLIILIGIIVAGGIYIERTGSLFFVPSEAHASLYDSYRDEVNFIYGDSDAPTTIIEFSDFECPYCARLHPVLKRIVDESNGSIKWELRHSPLANHANAEAAAYAAECVGRLGGNDAFWSFVDAAFADQRSLGTELYNRIASDLGVDREALKMCMEDEVIHAVVAFDREKAVSFGGSGTPFSIILYENGETRSVPGALPYSSWVNLIQ